MSSGVKKVESSSTAMDAATTQPSAPSASTSAAAQAPAPRRSGRPRAPRQLDEDMVALTPVTRRKRARNDDGSGPGDSDSHNNGQANATQPTHVSPAPARKTYVAYDFEVPDNVQAFYEKFFKLSDDPTAHDEYAEQFRTSCKFRVGAMKTLKTPAEIRRWRDKAWEPSIVSRCHRIEDVFLYNDDYKDRVMMKGHVYVGMQDGTESKTDFAAHMYYSSCWDIDDSGAGCTIHEYIVWEAPGQDDEDEDEDE